MSAVELTAGGLGGATGILCTQPLDTIRIRLQNPDFGYRGILHCARATIKSEGIRGLYKGVGSPLATVGLMNAVLFYSFELTLTTLYPSAESYTILQTVTAGMLSGVASVFISSPTELVKIRAQCNVNSKGTLSEEVAIAKQLLKMGPRDGLPRGLLLCGLRDVPSFGVYFGVYEVSCQILGKSTMGMLVSGGLAGALSWASVYPVDVFKTHWQNGSTAQYKSYADCYRALVAREAAATAFTRGLGTTLLRAFPQCGIVFCTYELVKAQLGAE